MALIRRSRAFETDNKHFPQIVVENVYISGVPKLLQRIQSDCQPLRREKNLSR